MPRPPGASGEGEDESAETSPGQPAGTAGAPGAETEGDAAGTAGGAAETADGAAGRDGPDGTAGVDGMDDDGWVTSNQIPGSGTPGQAGATMPGTSPGSGRDSVLDRALEGLDGQILAERAVIQARANETADPSAAGGAGGASTSAGDPGADGVPGDNGSSAGVILARSMPGVPTNRSAPPGPGPVAGSVPDDIPTGAHDDDIIARQLREAAMQEPDPELREKLWDEYRRYKGI